MRLIRKIIYNKWISGAALGMTVFLLIFFLLAACFDDTPPASPQGAATPDTTTIATSTPTLAKAPMLPGQQTWKQGASSLLFGTNDTYEWTNKNIQTEPSIQQALRTAGITLIRSFFPDNATDAQIEQRMQTIENSNARCLGVITNIKNVTFDEHLLRYLGKRCQMYEFGNESDLNGISIQDYLTQWNTVIPLLRSIDHSIKFIGPVTYTYVGNHDFMQKFLDGVKISGILPDAVSFHWYPCYQDTKDACLAKASSYGPAVQQVRTMVETTLGKNLPIGVTEWNYDPSNPPPSYGDDANFITQFTNAAIRSMAQAGVAFACQFDAASYSGYGRLDMFDVDTDEAKPQYYAMKDLIQQYRLASQTSQQVSTVVPTTGTSTSGPLISRGKPVFCQNNDYGVGGPQAIVNGHYGNWSFWRPSVSSLPSWCAIQVGAGPGRLLMTWESDYTTDYLSDKSLGPQDYTIAVSADSTNGSDGTWQTVVTIMGNHARTREHLLPFTGMSWVKMTITQGQPNAPQPYVFIDQVDLYDASSNVNDTFFFSGDSLTADAYTRSDATQPSFAELVHTSYPTHFPVMINGGLGGWSSDGAVQYMDQWLALNPDMHYWLLEWGTNDAFNQMSNEHFRANLQALVDKIKQAGHVPVIAHLPYASRDGLDPEIRALNGVIDEVTASNNLIPGPDLYQLFYTHAQQYLLSDGIHANDAGSQAMNLAWFQAMRSIYQ